MRQRSSWFQHDGYMLGRLDAAILKALGSLDGGTGCSIIDIGSGMQPYAAAIRQRGSTYVPCDLGPGPHATLQPGQTLPLPAAAFDVGLSVQVLEHVWDLDEYLAHFRRHLTPDGRLILSTHGVWLFHPHPADFRRWTRTGLVRELETRGFEVEQIIPILGPLAWTTQFRAMGYIYALRRLGLIGSLLARITGLVMNSRMWLEDLLTPARVTRDNACVYVTISRQSRQ